MNPRFHEFCKEIFGCKVYKLSLDGGMTCPTRDGTLGVSGCRFCSSCGSGDFAAQTAESVAVQLEEAKKRVAHKNKNGKYMAYFQSHTNTYAPVSYLRPLFTQAMAPDDIVALSVANRPDCLPPETVALLAELNQKKPVFVELGLQTIVEEVATAMGRGFPLSTFDQAMKDLRAVGISVIVHMIIGLPGQTVQETVETARYIGQSGAQGIKLQLLHILDDAPLAQDWREGRVPTLEMEEYLDILEQCLAVLPPDMVLHRLTGDGDKKHLLAPLWSGDKKRVLYAMEKRFFAKG